MKFMPAVSNDVRTFELQRDAFAFANETRWLYGIDAATGRQTVQWRDKVPDYTLRCFVMVRAVKQFYLHARFDPVKTRRSEDEYQHAAAEVLRRSPRLSSEPRDKVDFHGFASLREFSRAHETLLKKLCGGAWRSYVQRGNWRMVFPMGASHQRRTAEALNDALEQGVPQAAHVFRFPELTINHTLLIFSKEDKDGCVEYSAYDPNTPDASLCLTYRPGEQSFHLPPTTYFKGGRVKAYLVYRNWIY